MKNLIGILLLTIIMGRSNSNQANTDISSDKNCLINLMLGYPDLVKFINNGEIDTVYLIKNEHLNNENVNHKLIRKPVVFVNKPVGYPKYGKFDNTKFQISFELLKIKGDDAEGSILIKSVGVLSFFKFIRHNYKWKVSGYSKGMI
ncbi:hypothetical protein [Pedobacter agri]|uniref:hypothetical protein n=1 Tax=Pedobacter agri TaxID=454586 RepID=UPI00292E37C6|nr:hypothetical protein [Pedobacter agri]